MTVCTSLLCEKMKSLIIFTDLDGTLLNHDDYSYADALPAIEELKKNKIPLIMTTSKTRAEIQQYVEELQMDSPIIAENGAVVFLGGEVMRRGPEYEELTELLEKVKQEHRFQFLSFNEMSVRGVAEDTGLPLEKAEKAKQREATEPLKWLDSEDNLRHFAEVLRENKLTLIKGGRYYHVMDEGASKGKAAQAVKERLCSACQSVGLGDSPNDFSLLEFVDIPVVVRHHTGVHKVPPELSIGFPKDFSGGLIQKFVKDKKILLTEEPGALGWNRAVLEILRSQ